ncbi:MAG TPA: SDR family oxidoreductase [Stellaceae bacterium]|jgi:NAD(P)-dependent dehydrogenase (short-subunit alcohol dehydrogenase family)|nr:SDR family oxidoreductase [Stellaceae bacterium]
MAEPQRVALVTGASAGIGFETALGLAHAGFHVIIAGRDPARTEEAARSVCERANSSAVETAIADFASLDAVRELAETVLARHERLDVLVNNAGQITPRYQKTEDGYEMTFAVNHLAPFLLTNLLLDRLRESAPSRIVTVASQAHKGAQLNLLRLHSERRWNSRKAYGRAKLCNILFTRSLARRLEGSGVFTACLHPGVVRTAIGDRAGSLAGLGWRLVKPFLIGPEEGAETSLFLATTADPTTFYGTYVIGKKIAAPDALARDDDLAEQLWTESARLVGL